MKKEQLVIICLEEITGGKKTFEQCAANYPAIAGELKAMLEVSARLSAAQVAPGEEFKKRAAAAISKEMGAGATDPGVGRSPWRFKNLFSPGSLAFRVVAAIVIIVLSSGGTVYASKDSLPGDTLYPVKRGVENARLALTFTAEGKAGVYLERVRERVDETLKVTEKEGQPGVASLEDVPEEIDLAVRRIVDASGEKESLLALLMEITASEQASLAPLLALLPGPSPLAQSLDALRRGNLIGEIGYYNREFLAVYPSVLDETLEHGIFRIEGSLLTVEDGEWNVGGIRLVNVSEPSGAARVGTWLLVEGIISANATFIWHIEDGAAVGGKTVIEGIVSEKDDDELVAYIGGLEFRGIDFLKSIPEGTFLHIEGDEVEGLFHPDEEDDDDTGEDGENQTGDEADDDSYEEDESAGDSRYSSPAENSGGTSWQDTGAVSPSEAPESESSHDYEEDDHEETDDQEHEEGSGSTHGDDRQHDSDGEDDNHEDDD